ncbi:hypothetical protein CQA49_09265 [Helicobacter sp. MIT 00-7814]|uniref:hypothetical protein n=1 Tax=unclassified Helicobacter TaxID=2593540 RepID=UPI000E1F23CF|nr:MULTISPECIES: hypothetical protein [unclassified Helicobacter]RDU51712.1 hypothetical protein CQA49_09265 [Helicobacter sp. MIT 00-7814]RDU52373.1 hypothetical protein CQA37_08560 [Helicobacter sp. MIT 99-10781]
MSGKTHNLILRFSFEIFGSAEILEFFLKYWAQKCKIPFFIHAQGDKGDKVELYAQGDKENLEDFSNVLASKIPHLLFLRDTQVTLAEHLPQGAHLCQNFENKEFRDFRISQSHQPNSVAESTNLINQKMSSMSAQAKCNEAFAEPSGIHFREGDTIDGIAGTYLTPLGVESGTNEFGSHALDEVAKSLTQAILQNKSAEFGDYTLRIFSDFSCDYIMPTHLSALAKMFVCDEASLVRLASFEKPILSLRLSAIFRNAAPNAPLFFDVRACWDLSLKRVCEALYKEGINFLGIESKARDLRITQLENGFAITQGMAFLDSKSRAFLDSHKEKNTALWELIKNEFLESRESVPYARAFFSIQKRDYIFANRQNKDYLVFKVPLPSSFEAIYEELKKREGGERLLQNYQKAFELPRGEFVSVGIAKIDNLYTLFLLLAKMLQFEGDFFALARDYGSVKGNKGVRIDFKLRDTNELDCVRVIRSALSFRLAGASEGNIAFGCIESLALFLSDFSDKLESEYGITRLVCFGALFSHPTLANLTLKHTKITRISQRYPLEL